MVPTVIKHMLLNFCRVRVHIFDQAGDETDVWNIINIDDIKMKIEFHPQASVPALQATRHLRSPILLQTSTETFNFTQSTSSPEQALMEEEEVATPKVSKNFPEGQPSTAVSKTATAEELHNTILVHELGF